MSLTPLPIPLPSSTADGQDVAAGTTTDAAYTSGAGTRTSLLKGIFTRLRGGQATMANSLPVTLASDQSAVPISAASLPLPAGAATAAKQPALGQTTKAGSVPVTLASDQGTVDVNIISGGTGGGPMTVVDGGDVALGNTADASTANTVIGRLKKLISLHPAALGSTTSANSLPVVIASDQAAVPVTGTFYPGTQPVSGTFFQATQPVSVTSLPLPAGAATSAKQPALGSTTGANSTPVVIASDQASITVDGVFWQATQPVSAASLPLPSGAATAAKQPALGAAAMAASTPVTIASDQTPLDVIRGEGWSAATLTATGAAAFTGTDVTAYAWVAVQITANTSANTLTFQCSLDNTTFVPCALFPVVGGASVSTTTTTGMWAGFLVGSYFQIAHSGGGTIAGTVLFKQTPGGH